MLARERLREFRCSQGLSRAQMAAYLGCEESFVGLLERGQRSPGLGVAHSIEQLTAAWPHGPIRTEEWLDKESTGSAA